MPIARTSAVFAAAMVAAVVAAPVTAHAADDLVAVELRLPETVPGAVDDSAEAVEWTMQLIVGADVKPPATVTIDFGFDLAAADAPVLVNVDDDRCNIKGTTVVCEAPDLSAGENPFSFLLRDNWNSDDTGPVKVSTTVEAAGKTASDSGQFSITPDTRAGRLDFALPETVSSDLTPGSDGVAVPFTVVNNSDKTLSGAGLDVLVGEPDVGSGPTASLVFADEKCEGGSAYETTHCAIDSLAPGDRIEFAVTMYVDPKWSGDGSVPVAATVQEAGQTWAAKSGHTTIVAADKDGEDPKATLPKTGFGLTVPLMVGAGLLLAAGAMLAVTRRRSLAGN